VRHDRFAECGLRSRPSDQQHHVKTQQTIGGGYNDGRRVAGSQQLGPSSSPAQSRARVENEIQTRKNGETDLFERKDVLSKAVFYSVVLESSRTLLEHV